MQRETIVNLKNYEIVLTTSYETKHGISGHLFEMIEYFMFFRFYKKINACILLSDGTTLDEFFVALIEKYDLSFEEINEFKQHTLFKLKPKVILAKKLLITDGSLRVCNADLITEKTILFRCFEKDIVRDKVLVLQDNEVYEKIPNGVHYKKKILFEKYKKIEKNKTNSAMFYLTINSRNLKNEEVQKIIQKHKFQKYLVLSNDNLKIDNVEILKVPVENLWNLFDTYIYTNTSKSFDCSPRFIAECSFYDKEVIYETDYIDKGLEIRINDIKNKKIFLKEDDEICSRI